MIIFTELDDLAFCIKNEIKNDVDTLPFQLRDIVSCKCAPQYKFIVVNFLTKDFVICKDDESTDLYIFDVEDIKKVGFKNVVMGPFSLHYTHLKDSYNKKNVVFKKEYKNRVYGYVDAIRYVSTEYKDEGNIRNLKLFPPYDVFNVNFESTSTKNVETGNTMFVSEYIGKYSFYVNPKDVKETKFQLKTYGRNIYNNTEFKPYPLKRVKTKLNENDICYYNNNNEFKFIINKIKSPDLVECSLLFNSSQSKTIILESKLMTKIDVYKQNNIDYKSLSHDDRHPCPFVDCKNIYCRMHKKFAKQAQPFYLPDKEDMFKFADPLVFKHIIPKRLTPFIKTTFTKQDGKYYSCIDSSSYHLYSFFGRPCCEIFNKLGIDAMIMEIEMYAWDPAPCVCFTKQSLLRKLSHNKAIDSEAKYHANFNGVGTDVGKHHHLVFKKE